MPNLCLNFVTIKGKSKEILRFMRDFYGDGSYSMENVVKLPGDVEAKNYFGADYIYDFNCKLNTQEIEEGNFSAEELNFSFSSPWRMPDSFFYMLQSYII